MLRALTADAVFIAAVFFEVLAGLSILQSIDAAAVREELEPVLALYRAQAVPILALAARLFWARAPQWFLDAAVLAAVLFFLFFIAQARNAMAPLGAAGSSGAAPKAHLAEAAIDWLLPVLACGLGAILLAPALLAFLTLPASAVLGLRKLIGRPCWFELSRAYYVNLACAGIALGLIVLLQ